MRLSMSAPPPKLARSSSTTLEQFIEEIFVGESGSECEFSDVDDDSIDENWDDDTMDEPETETVWVEDSIPFQIPIDKNEARASRYGLDWTSMRRMIFLGVPLVCFNLMWWLVNESGWDMTRDIDVLHAFGGEGAVHHAATERGLKSVLWDIRVQGDDGNILLPQGFLRLLWYCMRLKVLGGAHFDVVCSTWVWVAMKSTGRRSFLPMGPPRPTRKVHNGNLMSNLATILYMVLMGNRVPWCLEQPNSSLMLQATRLVQAQAKITQHTRLIRTWMGCYGALTPKLTKLLSPCDLILPLQRTMSRQRRTELREAMAASSDGPTATVDEVKRAQGRPCVTGNKRGLQRSQAHPPEYGRAWIEALLNWVAKHGAEWDVVPAHILEQVLWTHISPDMWLDANLPLIAQSVGISITRLAA